MLKPSQLTRALNFEKLFGNPRDNAINGDNGKPNLPGTRTAYLLDLQNTRESTDLEKLSQPQQNGQ